MMRWFLHRVFSQDSAEWQRNKWPRSAQNEYTRWYNYPINRIIFSCPGQRSSSKVS